MFVFDPAVESVELDGILDVYQDVVDGKAASLSVMTS